MVARKSVYMPAVTPFVYYHMMVLRGFSDNVLRCYIYSQSQLLAYILSSKIYMHIDCGHTVESLIQSFSMPMVVFFSDRTIYYLETLSENYRPEDAFNRRDSSTRNHGPQGNIFIHMGDLCTRLYREKTNN